LDDWAHESAIKDSSTNEATSECPQMQRVLSSRQALKRHSKLPDCAGENACMRTCDEQDFYHLLC